MLSGVCTVGGRKCSSLVGGWFYVGGDDRVMKAQERAAEIWGVFKDIKPDCYEQGLGAKDMMGWFFLN